MFKIALSGAVCKTCTVYIGGVTLCLLALLRCLLWARYL